MKSWFFVLEICICANFMILVIQATVKSKNLANLNYIPSRKLLPRRIPKLERRCDQDKLFLCDNLPLQSNLYSDINLEPDNDEISFPYEISKTFDDQEPYESIGTLENSEFLNDQTNLLSSLADNSLIPNTTSDKFSVPLINDGTDTFFAQVKIGGIKFLQLLDTSSCWYWVRGRDCQTNLGDKSCNGQKYDYTQSKTYNKTNETFGASYLGGKVQCQVGIEEIQLGESLILNQQKFGMSIVQQHYERGGVFGLRPKCTVYQMLFDEIVKNREGIVKPVFSINLIRKNPEQKEDEKSPGGELLLGGIMTEMIEGGSGGIVYPRMFVQNDWEVALEDVLVDGRSLQLGTRGFSINSGFKFIEMPEKDAEMIHDLFAPGAQRAERYWLIKCDTQSIISFVFKGAEFPLHLRDMTSQRLDKDVCVSGISSSSSPTSPWIVGVPFLKNVISVYDTSIPQIGFGRKVKSTA
ncbi:hypothetical protein G9A89_007255 [Geosiphon pyriformis]|nr:hypothetical protein G9A89_007255 [Geosiphon pyriformis]